MISIIYVQKDTLRIVSPVIHCKGLSLKVDLLCTTCQSRSQIIFNKINCHRILCWFILSVLFMYGVCVSLCKTFSSTSLNTCPSSGRFNQLFPSLLQPCKIIGGITKKQSKMEVGGGEERQQCVEILAK